MIIGQCAMCCWCIKESSLSLSYEESAVWFITHHLSQELEILYIQIFSFRWRTSRIWRCYDQCNFLNYCWIKTRSASFIVMSILISGNWVQVFVYTHTVYSCLTTKLISPWLLKSRWMVHSLHWQCLMNRNTFSCMMLAFIRSQASLCWICGRQSSAVMKYFNFPPSVSFY